MSDDIVTRLRTALDEMELGCLACSIINQNDHDSDCLTQNAADEIERLRAELHKQSLKANIMRNVAMVPYGDSAGVIEELMADRDRWVEIAQLWDGAYSAQTYIHGLDEIETADMARKAQAKAVRGE